MKQATELIRVAAYKKNLDLKNKLALIVQERSVRLDLIQNLQQVE